MYKIKCDNHTLYDAKNEELILGSLTLNLEDNTAGTLAFSILPDHPYYEAIHKLRSEIVVLKNDEIIFKGRPVEDKLSFNNVKKIECEGKLACFNDSVFRSFEFKGTPEELFRQVIENHNSQVSKRQQFKIGNVTVKDNNDFIVRSAQDNTCSWDILKSRCFDSSLGGHIQVRYEEDGDYIDWLADFSTVASQTIEFGENLLDLSQAVTASETYTAMIPLGAEVNEKRVTIESVNGGKDFIVNEEMAALYGIIYAPQEVSKWDDVTTPAALIKKAREVLDSTGIKLRETIQVKAIDLNLTDKEIESFRICEYININSKPHNLSKTYLLSKMQMDLESPQNSVFTLGVTKATLTDIQRSQRQTAKNVETYVKEVQGKIPTTLSQLENDSSYMTEEQVVKYVDENAGTGSSGKDGVSPTVEVVENTEDSYKLKITDADKTIETPNLKGRQGETGGTGATGEQGKQGIQGEQGEPGTDATIEIGSVQTGEPGTDASVTNSGTASSAVFNFVIPRGEKGAAGEGGSGGDSPLFSFAIKEDGHLYVSGETQDVNNFYIASDGHLKYKVGGDEMYEIDLGSVVGQGSGGGIELGEKTTFDGGWYRKIGDGLVEITLGNMSSAKTWNAGFGAILTTMPEGYRPDGIVYATAHDINGVLLEINISASGAVSVSNRTSTSKSVRYLKGHVIFSVEQETL